VAGGGIYILNCDIRVPRIQGEFEFGVEALGDHLGYAGLKNIWICVLLLFVQPFTLMVVLASSTSGDQHFWKSFRCTDHMGLY
jgi:hypothetical protein